MSARALPRRETLRTGASLVLGASALLLAPRIRAAARGTVQVAYAGSLVQVMNTQIGPGFERATGYRFAGLPGGAQALAEEIASGQVRADVFVSAATGPDELLLRRPAHGAIAWYAPFASSPLVIGYNPRSRFAAALRRGPWYRVMAEPGFRLGRTDPRLDPKGALTVRFAEAAARYYHDPRLVQQVLGSPENPAQVFPEETLVARLQAGQLDAGFFYRSEAVAARLPYLTPPAALTFGALYTVALPAGGPDPAGAIAFVRYLLGPAARAMLVRDGFTLETPKAVTTDPATVPAALRALLHVEVGPRAPAKGR
jgi:molybdate/tungstate transport system substrate-binding protein